MEFDRREQKMLLAFISVNFAALGIGILTLIVFNLIAALVAFTVSVIIFPVLLQKYFLKKLSEN